MLLQASISEEMRQVSPHGDRYVYTSHSWLISMFLDCPPHMGLQCPNATTVAAVTRAIQRGDITWHAHPHNAQYEVYDTSLLEFSFDFTHALDDSFKLPHKHTAILVSGCSLCTGNTASCLSVHGVGAMALLQCQMTGSPCTVFIHNMTRFLSKALHPKLL